MPNSGKMSSLRCKLKVRNEPSQSRRGSQKWRSGPKGQSERHREGSQGGKLRVSTVERMDD